MKGTTSWIADPIPASVLFLVGVALAESVILLYGQPYGLALYAVLLNGLLLYVAGNWQRASRRSLLCLALAPINRLSSSFVLSDGSTLALGWLVVNLSLLLAAALIIRMLGISWADSGLNSGRILWQIPIALSGLVLGVLLYRVPVQATVAGSSRWDQTWVLFLVLLALNSFVEELSYRGIMGLVMRNTMRNWGVIYVAALYTIQHVGLRSPLIVLIVLMVSLLFGWVVSRTRSIVGVSISHALMNVLYFLILPSLASAQ